MGLDLVELVLSVEEEFDVLLPDSELEKMRTPMDLTNYVYDRYQEVDYSDSKQEKKNNDFCSSQVGFYRLRNILIGDFGIEKDCIKPDANLTDIFPTDIRSKWQRLSGYLKYELPPLSFSRPVDMGVYFGSLFMIVFFMYGKLIQSLFLLIFVLLVHMAFYMVVKNFFARTVPQQAQKIRDIIGHVGITKKISKYSDKQSILDKVIEISIEQLNLSPSEIKPDSRYVEDLGID